MDDRPENRQKFLDEMLATFTDQVLNTRQSERSRVTNGNAELHSLEKTVLRLEEAFEGETLSTQSARRIRSRLEGEWRKMHTDPHALRSGWRGILQRWRHGSKIQQRRTLAFGVALACVVLLVVLGIFSPSIEMPPVGAAGMTSEWYPLLIVFGVVVVVVVILLTRFKNR